METYLDTNEIKRSAFAVQLGVSASTVTRLIDGSRMPSGALLATIEAKTNGAVTFQDFDWQGKSGEPTLQRAS